MIIPCIDLMDGRVVQLVQGRDKALEGAPPAEMLERFAAFEEIQVIDLDAALGGGSNDDIVQFLAGRARIRAGGGVRTSERARTLADQGAHRIIIGTAAFQKPGTDGSDPIFSVNAPFLAAAVDAVGRERVIIALDSKAGRIVVKGWREQTPLSAEKVVRELEPYCSGFLCTYVDKEGMMQGTDLDWFRRLRAATSLEITAAGGITTTDEIRELDRLGIHSALGMAIYTGRLNLEELAELNRELTRRCS